MNTDKKQFCFRLYLYLCLSVPHLWLNCLSSKASAQEPEFTIHAEQPAGPALVGCGAEMNPYLYCRPNWVGGGASTGEVNEQNVADLERKVLDLAPQHVRIFCLLEWFTPEGDKTIAKGDPRMKESFYRT